MDVVYLVLIIAGFLLTAAAVRLISPYQDVALVQPYTAADGTPVTQQTLALGPAASQIAIKQLGTNGGGFFGVNSAHPFENPTALSNFLECLAILLIPLTVLIRNAGRVITHRQLLKEVWGPGSGNETHYLRVYMNQLRQKIEREPERPRYLQTEVGVGYRLDDTPSK